MRFTGSPRQALFQALLVKNTNGMPGPIHETIFFGRYRAEVGSISQPEKDKLEKIAKLVAASWAPGSTPIRHIRVEGHADHDALGRQFEFDTSRDRMTAVKNDLTRRIKEQLDAQHITTQGTVDFDGAAFGASKPFGSPDRTKNRRAEIYCSPEGPPIPIEPPKPTTASFLTFKQTRQEVDTTKQPGEPGDSTVDGLLKALKVASQMPGDIERMRRHPVEAGDPDPNPIQNSSAQDLTATHVMLECTIEQEIREKPPRFTFGGVETGYIVTRRYFYVYGAGQPGSQVRVTRKVSVFNDSGGLVQQFPPKEILVNQPLSQTDP